MNLIFEQLGIRRHGQLAVAHRRGRGAGFESRRRRFQPVPGSGLPVAVAGPIESVPTPCRREYLKVSLIIKFVTVATFTICALSLHLKPVYAQSTRSTIGISFFLNQAFSDHAMLDEPVPS